MESGLKPFIYGGFPWYSTLWSTPSGIDLSLEPLCSCLSDIRVRLCGIKFSGNWINRSNCRVLKSSSCRRFPARRKVCWHNVQRSSLSKGMNPRNQIEGIWTWVFDRRERESKKEGYTLDCWKAYQGNLSSTCSLMLFHCELQFKLKARIEERCSTLGRCKFAFQ